MTPIIFFGTDDFSGIVLSTLFDAGFPVQLVVTKPDAQRGRGQKVSEPLIKTLAEAHGVRVLQPLKLSEITADITALQPVAGVLASYGKIIPQAILELFTPGIINVHPSLLPHYRGPSPVESAILNGDHKTGVSIIRLVSAMDAGPLYAQTAVTLGGYETQPILEATLARTGASLLIETLPGILDGSLLPTPQDDAKATYSHLLKKTSSLINPSALTAIEADRHVRAYTVYPKTKLTFQDATIIITKAHVANQPKTALDQRCKDGKYLVIDQLVAPSGKTMAAEAFLRGYAAA